MNRAPATRLDAPAAAMRLTALVGAVAVAVTALLAARSPVCRALREGRPLCGLLIGTDLVDHARHSDTLILWRYAPVDGRLDLLSIPRDTLIDLPGYRFRRVNEVFSYHHGVTRRFDAAARETMAGITYLLGGPGAAVRPEHYIHVGYEAFRRFIDRLGGIVVVIPEAMHYEDRAGGYAFHREPGTYRMDGRESLAYVRFRGQSGDRGRVLRQLEFLKAVAEKALSPLALPRWPGLLWTTLKGFDTDLRPWDVAALALEAKHFKSKSVNPRLLPGAPQGAFWAMDRERTARVLAQIAGEELPSDRGPATVKVWNGTAREGLALEATRRLREGGVDVVEFGNHGARQTVTRVIDRAGDIEKARKVAQTLGVGAVFSELHPSSGVDVEVVLGEDYK